jgi:ribosome-binding factor A
MSRIKQDRMAGRIRTILSELLLREVSDPRLYNITITNVTMDPELVSARVFVNALGDEGRQKEIMLALEHAKGFLRREVGSRVRLRKTPELFFRWDKALDHAEHINELLSTLHIPPAEVEDMPIEEVADSDDDE